MNTVQQTKLLKRKQVPNESKKWHQNKRKTYRKIK